MSKQDVIDYVMETPHNTNRAVLEGLVDTAVEEGQVQADWDQNDETAKDYIKNRICYAEDGTIDVYYDSANNELNVRSINLQLGATYNVKTSTDVSVVPSGDGTDYICKKITDVISELSSIPEYENVLCIGGWNSETHHPNPFLITDEPQLMSTTVKRYLITGSNLKINALSMKYLPTDLSLLKVVTYDSENNKYAYVNKDVEFLQPTIGTYFKAGNHPVGSNSVIYTGMPAYDSDGQSPFRVESDIIPYIDTYCNFNLEGNNLPDIALGKSVSYDQSNASGIVNAENLKIFQQKYAKLYQNSVIIRGIIIFKDATLTGYCTLDNDSTDDKPKISFFDSYKGKIYKCSFTANGDKQTLVEIQNIWDSTIVSSSDVLTKTNITAFTPTADYHPATKKYVDDTDALTAQILNEIQDAIIRLENTQIPTSLKNPYSMKVIQGAATTTYDGSEEKTITVPTTTDVNANTTARHSHSNKSILDQITKVPADYTLPTASASVLGGVKPVEKTSAMTQSVGVDANGLLYTAPGSSSGGGTTITIKTWTEADVT